MKTLRSTVATFVIGTSLAAGVVVGLAPHAANAAPSPTDKVKVSIPDGSKFDPSDVKPSGPIDPKTKVKICDIAPELCTPKDPKPPKKDPEPEGPKENPKGPKAPGTPQERPDEDPPANPDTPVKTTRVVFTG